jgi:hypothetical protein
MVAQSPEERHFGIDVDRMSGAVNGKIDHDTRPNGSEISVKRIRSDEQTL